jgi:hypothetical protein
MIALDHELRDRVPVEIVPLLPVICGRCGAVTFFSVADMDLEPDAGRGDGPQ